MSSKISSSSSRPSYSCSTDWTMRRRARRSPLPGSRMVSFPYLLDVRRGFVPTAEALLSASHTGRKPGASTNRGRDESRTLRTFRPPVGGDGAAPVAGRREPGPPAAGWTLPEQHSAAVGGCPMPGGVPE